MCLCLNFIVMLYNIFLLSLLYVSFYIFYINNNNIIYKCCNFRSLLNLDILK